MEEEGIENFGLNATYHNYSMPNRGPRNLLVHVTGDFRSFEDVQTAFEETVNLVFFESSEEEFPRTYGDDFVMISYSGQYFIFENKNGSSILVDDVLDVIPEEKRREPFYHSDWWLDIADESAFQIDDLDFRDVNPTGDYICSIRFGQDDTVYWRKTPKLEALLAEDEEEFSLTEAA